jgi:hypothetical protein
MPRGFAMTPIRATVAGGGGGTGTDDHSLLSNRSAANAHPITAITNLSTELDGKADIVHSHDDLYYTESEVDALIAGVGGGGGAVDSVNGQTGAVVLDNTDVGAATTAQGALADTAVQPGDLATVATTGAYSDLTGTPTLGTAADNAETDFATAAQGALADSAVQGNGLTLWTGTQAAYDALGTYSNTTVYVISG